MPGTHSSVPSHSEQIRRLAGIADTIGAMLGTFDILPGTGQDDALAVSASLADDLAKALATIAEEVVSKLTDTQGAISSDSESAQPSDWRAGQTTFPNPPEVGPQPPLRFLGGDLGFLNEWPVTVEVSTPEGRQCWALEPVLKNIDLFAEPDRSRILYMAGHHFKICPWLMVDPTYQVTERDLAHWGDDDEC
jgi:hypothetical protein